MNKSIAGLKGVLSEEVDSDIATRVKQLDLMSEKARTDLKRGAVYSAVKTLKQLVDWLEKELETGVRDD